MKEETEVIGLQLDTGQFREEVLRRLKIAIANSEEAATLARRVADAWDAEHKAAEPKRDLMDALISGLGQFVAEWSARKDARKKNR
ncbi:MAG: hypothetical protein EHM33_01075 [Chloroflexi bacterium]|nr:MAG: hypothetical protein EHM33_01075 [Chloroflexota bacterium]